jgi:hypothetical protein
MRLKLGGWTFDNVRIPVLWGKRAILQDSSGRLSVVDLGGQTARIEILGDQVARGVRFSPSTDGFMVLTSERQALYTFSPRDRRLTSESLGLPELQIKAFQIRVGTNTFQSAMVSGFDVGIVVDEDGRIGIGAPLPEGLAALVV